MSMILDGSNGVTFNDASLQGAAASPFVLKNRIINGDMRIDQRNAGASVTQLASVVYGVDRWYTFGTVTSKFTAQQNAGSVTPPEGFTNYWGITSSSSYTPGTSEQFIIAQGIEGYNIADLNYGTASAKTITLSFWVRSSLSGTFAGGLGNSANNRSYSFNYTISAANTWEQKTVTIAGDTTGTWDSTNGAGIYVNFSMGTGSTFQSTANTWVAGNFKNVSGSVNVVGTNGATWYVTGVQLEQNTSATPFERRLYGQELINCQRYYEQIVIGNMQIPNGSGSAMINPISFHVQKRASPTMATITAATTNGAATVQLNGVSVNNFGLQFINSSTTNNFFTNEPVYSASVEL
jgi:hypothetical protein